MWYLLFGLTGGPLLPILGFPNADTGNTGFDLELGHVKTGDDDPGFNNKESA